MVLAGLTTTRRGYVIAALASVHLPVIGNALLGFTLSGWFLLFQGVLLLRLGKPPWPQPVQRLNGWLALPWATLTLLTAPARHDVGGYNTLAARRVPGFIPGWLAGVAPMLIAGCVVAVRRKLAARHARSSAVVSE